MVTAWSGGEVLKNIEKVLKKSWKGIKINFKIPAYTLIKKCGVNQIHFFFNLYKYMYSGHIKLIKSDSKDI